MTDEMEKLTRHTLWNGLDDWISLAGIDASARAYFHDAQDLKDRSLECMRILVGKGYAEHGDLGPGGFRASDQILDEYLATISEIYSLPGTGFGFWLRNTKRGDAHALEDPENDS